MTLGPVMLDLVGTELAPEEREMLRHPLVGGVILFTRNYASPDQVQALVAAIHRARREPLIVAVDHEGGRVQRFRPGFTRLPPGRAIGRRYDADPADGRRVAATLGWLMAAELRALGIDLSFAPVLDLDRGVSEVIGDRSFNADAERVADIAYAYMQGMHRAGMAAVGKHFPGHGSVEADSHLALPLDERPFEAIREDMRPFERMIKHGLDAIMPAHVVYAQVDPAPAGFSPFWNKEILRHQFGFDGVIFSDDLNMAAAVVAGSFVDRAHVALEAGCDMVLVCNNPNGAVEILDGMGGIDHIAAQRRLERMRGRAPAPVFRSGPEWAAAARLAEELNQVRT